MAMLAPAHRIHSIHGSFGGPSFSSLLSTTVSSVSTDQASSFASLPNITYTASRAAARGSSIRSRPASSSATPPPVPPPQLEFKTRPRSRSFSSPHAPVITRRQPPPPPSRSVELLGSEDPFADTPANQTSGPVIISLPPPSRYSRAAWKPFDPEAKPSEPASAWSAPVYRPTVTAPPCTDRKAAKLVANVLLSRACGRPMRRRGPQSCTEERPYVKSCLSRMVALD